MESLIWKIKKLGKKVGLALNPPTPISLVQPFLDKMAVHDVEVQPVGAAALGALGFFAQAGEIGGQE